MTEPAVLRRLEAQLARRRADVGLSGDEATATFLDKGELKLEKVSGDWKVSNPFGGP